MEMNDLQLLAGLPTTIKDVGSIHPLKLSEIAEMGEDRYNQFLNVLCFDVDDLELENVDLTALTTYDLIVTQCEVNKEYLQLVTDALSMFFKDKVGYSNEYYLFYLGDIRDGRIIYRDNYEDIKAIIRKQNFIQEKKKEEYNPANEQAKQFIEKLKRLKKERPKTKETVNLHSIISSIAWKSHIGIHAVWDLTIYQLFDAYYRLDVVDNYDKTLAGIYAGTVDASKINMKELNWSKIIRLQS